MEIRSEIRKHFRIRKRKYAVLVGIVAFSYVLLLLSYGVSLRYTLPDGRRLKLPNESNKLMSSSRNTLVVNVTEDSIGSGIHVLEKTGHVSDFGLRNESDDDEAFDETVDFESIEDVKDSVSVIKEVVESSDSLYPSDKNVTLSTEVSISKNVKSSMLSESSSVTGPASSVTGNSSLLVSKQVNKKKKIMRCNLPPKSVTTIDEMNQILAKHRRTSRAMRPRWSSRRDEEILAARKEIENAPVVKLERELYPSIFRNVSMFKR